MGQGKKATGISPPMNHFQVTQDTTTGAGPGPMARDAAGLIYKGCMEGAILIMKRGGGGERSEWVRVMELWLKKSGGVMDPKV